MSWKVAFLAALFTYASADQYCRGLALGGGSDQGPYQAGAIAGLLANLTAPESNYQIITGLGVGSINGLIASRFNDSQHAELASTLHDFWLTHTGNDFLKNWPLGELEGYFKKSGLKNSAPMYKTIKQLDASLPDFAVPFTAGATDLNTGNLIIFNNTLARENLLKGVYASASTFQEMPVVEYSNYTLVEGSLRYTADILGVANWCIAQGYAHEDIIVDTIFVQSDNCTEALDAASYRTLQVVARVAQIYNYDNIATSLKVAELVFPKVNLRYTILPKKNSLHSTRDMYSEGKLEKKLAYEQGYKDALQVIQEANNYE